MRYSHNPKYIHNFCNIAMRTSPQIYIKVINRKKDLDTTKLANEYIFQHCIEEPEAFEQISQEVHVWWETYIEKEKLLK